MFDVLVCQTCQRANMPDQAVRPGAQPLAELDNAELPAGVRVPVVDCLSKCKKLHNCSEGHGQMDLNIRKYQSSVGF